MSIKKEILRFYTRLRVIKIRLNLKNIELANFY